MAKACLLVDPSARLGLDELLASESRFRSFDAADQNIGYSEAAYWVRFDVRLRAGASERWYLSVHHGVDDARVFSRTGDGGWKVQRLGRGVDFTQRTLRDKTPFFPVTLTQEPQRFYVRLSSTDTLQLPLGLHTPERLTSQLATQHWRDGLYYGALFALILYNFLLYFRLRDSLYLYYVLFQASVVALQATLDQYTFAWLWPHAPAWNPRVEALSFALAMWAAYAFSRRFLALSESFARWDRWLARLQWLGLSIAAGMFTAESRAYETFCILYLLLSGAALLASGFIAALHGYRRARIYIAAWLVLLSGACVASLCALGAIDATELSEHTTRVGSAIEAILFALGLAQRIQELRLEKEAAQDALLRTRETYTVQLEHDVAQRTGELQTALDTLKRAQLSMVQQARLAALGHLVQGVVHEVGNPLNFLRGGADRLPRLIEEIEQALRAQERSLRETARLERCLEQARTAAELVVSGSDRIRQIVDNLREYASARSVAPVALDLGQAVGCTLQLLSRSLSEQRIDVAVDLAPLPPLHARPGELTQVLTNVLVNALQAMPSGGQLSVSGHCDGKRVRLEVQDSGPGVASEIREAIFDPFFTTRDPNQGTGLGLSIAREIVRRHGGELRLMPSASGACFELTMPCTV